MRYEQRQSSQCCGADGEAFTHSGSGVTNCVQLIGDVTNGVVQSLLISAIPPALSAMGP